MKIVRLTLCLFLSCCLILSCDKKTDAESESVILKSYRLIDEQRTDEAITLLEDEIKKDPDNYELTSTLASAYAHKAGFRIQKLIPLVSLSEKFSKATPAKQVSQDLEKKESEKKETEGKETEIKETESKKISGAILRISTALEVVDTIPTFSTEQIVFLDYAIHLLNTFGDKIKPEDIVYRAMLMVLKLKYNLDFGSKKGVSILDQADCKIDVQALNTSFQGFGKDLTLIADDIVKINPDQKEKLEQFKKNLNEALASFKTWSTQYDLLGARADHILKQALIQTQLLGAAQCL